MQTPTAHHISKDVQVPTVSYKGMRHGLLRLLSSCRLRAAAAAAATAAAVAVHAPPALLAQPPGVHVLHQQGAGPAW